MRIIETQRNEKGRSSTSSSTQPLKEKSLTSETRNFQEARGSSTLDFFEKKHFLDETLSERKSRRSNALPVHPRSSPPPPLVGKIFSVFTVHRSLARECPLKAGGGGGGAKKLSRRSKFRGGAFCPRDASPFPFLPRLEAGRSGLPFLLLRPPPPIRLAGGTRADGGGGGTHRNANLYYPRERERERSLPLDGASTRADSP